MRDMRGNEPLSIDQLRPQARENEYEPLGGRWQQQQQQQQEQQQELPEEPPPAYDDLYPIGKNLHSSTLATQPFSGPQAQQESPEYAQVANPIREENTVANSTVETLAEENDDSQNAPNESEEGQQQERS